MTDMRSNKALTISSDTAEAVLGFLGRIEWEAEGGHWEEGACPSCREPFWRGIHADDCELVAFRARLQGLVGP